MKLWKTKKSISCMPNKTIALKNEESTTNGGDLHLTSLISENRAMSPAQSEDSGLAPERGTTYATITLPRDNINNMGIVLAERNDLSYPPMVASLNPLGHAADFLAPGDRLHQIDGVSTIGLTNSHIMHMLCDGSGSIEGLALIEIEYSLPECMSQNSSCITSKLAQVMVERERGCLGLTLRGGGDYPLIVTHVRPNGPVHKTGRIKPGDRLLRVDNISLIGKTLIEAQKIIKCGHIADYANLTIEYDVSVVQNVEFSMGPLLIEIERPMNDKLGLVLCNFPTASVNEMSEHVKLDEISENSIFIASILPASLADRCGALSVGDQILAIDDINIENSTYTEDDVMTLLDSSTSRPFTQLQILPAHAISHRGHSTLGSPKYGFNTLESRKIRQRQRLVRKSSLPLENGANISTSLTTTTATTNINNIGENGALSSSNSLSTGTPNIVNGVFQHMSTGLGICRTETFPVLLDCSMGSGLVLGPQTSSTRAICVWDIIPESVADRCGCIQKGDRIVAINKMYNLDVATVRQLLGDVNQRTSLGPSNWLELEIEFDMPDTVVPSSGVFNVKVIKIGKAGLGLNVNNSNHGGCVITEVKPGSPAHRTGSLRKGDILLAIDNHPVQHFSVDSLCKNGFTTADVTTLTVKRVVLPDFLFDAQQKLPIPIYTNCPINDTDLYGSTFETQKYTDVKYNDCLSMKSSIVQSEYYTNSSLDENAQSIVQMRLHLDNNNWSNSMDRFYNQANTQSLTTEIPENESNYHEFNSSYDLDQRYSNVDCSNLPQPMENKIYGSLSGSKNTNSGNNLHKAILSVRLEPNSGILGITLAGSEDVNRPIIVSSLLEGGTAYESGQVQVGDELLAINGESLQGLPLSRATNLLQNISGPVDLKILRFLENVNSCDDDPNADHDISNVPKTQDLYAKVQRRPRSPCNTDGSLKSVKLDKQKLFPVSLFKDKVYDDYGFSISDGLYERGVFINRIRSGGPADKSGLLKPFDRIMQVNDIKTQDFDCCLTVPLIASAGDKIELMIQRTE